MGSMVENQYLMETKVDFCLTSNLAGNVMYEGSVDVIENSFKEEEASNYFSIYGPVQDVRIPYQQKRMFGFVTFVYPETVKLILANGNSYFICDSHMLVMSYKEKWKSQEK
ncbi:hypothetical protein V6N13_037716 [Hibiscus sabdariffa]|uniref:RRM domain-containing protein n=1 Tax=Hibiscus sabdariffa TaxID=183260 RepID=A0ABR2S4H0_9ROSI